MIAPAAARDLSPLTHPGRRRRATAPASARPPARRPSARKAAAPAGPTGRHYAGPVPPTGPPTADVAISEATGVDAELVTAMAALLPQLSSSAPPLTADDLAAVVDDPATSLFVARLGGRVVGSLTLAVFHVPTGVRAWIEDVVVDEAARGAGVGAALSAAAIERARQAGARTVDLTSRPSREAANRLYQRVGFARRDTNVYRFDLGS